MPALHLGRVETAAGVSNHTQATRRRDKLKVAPEVAGLGVNADARDRLGVADAVVDDWAGQVASKIYKACFIRGTLVTFVACQNHLHALCRSVAAQHHWQALCSRTHHHVGCIVCM